MAGLTTVTPTIDSELKKNPGRICSQPKTYKGLPYCRQLWFYCQNTGTKSRGESFYFYLFFNTRKTCSFFQDKAENCWKSIHCNVYTAMLLSMSPCSVSHTVLTDPLVVAVCHQGAGNTRCISQQTLYSNWKWLRLQLSEGSVQKKHTPLFMKSCFDPSFK